MLKQCNGSCTTCVYFLRKDCRGLAVAGLPDVLWIEPTTRCNLACPMCFRQNFTVENKELGFEDFTRILDSFEHVGQVHLQGQGEPFLNKSLMAMAGYAKRKMKARVGTVTNGTIIDEQAMKEIIDSGMSYLALSTESLLMQEKIRPGLKLQEHIRRVELISSYHSQIDLIMLVVLFERTYRELPRIVEFCGKHHFKTVIAKRLVTWKEDDLLSAPKDMEEFARVVEAAEKAAKIHSVELSLYNFKGKSNKCSWPWKASNINANGDVTPCFMLPGTKGIRIMGNAISDDFREIWNGPIYKEFRKDLIFGVNKECNSFWHDKPCNGMSMDGPIL